MQFYNTENSQMLYFLEFTFNFNNKLVKLINKFSYLIETIFKLFMAKRKVKMKQSYIYIHSII